MARPSKSQRTRTQTSDIAEGQAASLADSPLSTESTTATVDTVRQTKCTIAYQSDSVLATLNHIPTYASQTDSIETPISTPAATQTDYSSTGSPSEPSTPEHLTSDNLLLELSSSYTGILPSADQELGTRKLKSIQSSLPPQLTSVPTPAKEHDAQPTELSNKRKAQEDEMPRTEEEFTPSSTSTTTHLTQGKTIATSTVKVNPEPNCDYCNTFHSHDPRVHETSDGPITLYYHAGVPGIKSQASWTSDTEFILQILRNRQADLSTLPAIDSATAAFADGETCAGEIPVTTFFDAFPSNDVAYKKLLELVTHPGDARLHNLAFSNPADFYYKHKFIREVKDISITAKFFLFGKVMVCDLGDEGRGKQICIAPQACTFPRVAAVLGAIFKVNELGFYSYKSGVTFSTVLQPKAKNANFLKASPKKKMRYSTSSSSVLTFNDTLPVYDGRTLDFEPQNYEKLPKLSGSIPTSACAMIIFTVNSNNPTEEHKNNYKLQDYPTFASLNVLSAVYVLPPDHGQRQVMVNEPDDFIGVQSTAQITGA